MPIDPSRLRLIARRLGVVVTGSRLADEAVHAALGRAGYPPPYSTVREVAGELAPPGYETFCVVIGSRHEMVRYHAMCWQDDDRHTAGGHTHVAALLAAILRCLAQRAT